MLYNLKYKKQKKQKKMKTKKIKDSLLFFEYNNKVDIYTMVYSCLSDQEFSDFLSSFDQIRAPELLITEITL